MPNCLDLIEIENTVTPGSKRRVNRTKFMALREALLAVLPSAPPGMTVAEAKAAVLPRLSSESFPGGEKAGWWLKAVQLDLEAKGIVRRASEKPVRLYRESLV